MTLTDNEREALRRLRMVTMDRLMIGEVYRGFANKQDQCWRDSQTAVAVAVRELEREYMEAP